MAIENRTLKNTAYKTVLDVFDSSKLEEVAYEEGAMHVTDGGLYLHFNGSKVLLHPVAELQQQQTTVSSAEILDLDSTPVEIIPAQGDNIVINPISITVQRVEGGTPYTITNSLNFTIDNNVVFNVDQTILTNIVGIQKGTPQASGLVANVGLLLQSVAGILAGTGDIVVRVVYELIEI
jgi:hypothetical protein